MNVLRWGTGMIENTSPLGLILAGTVLAMASPPVRKGLRSAAVMTTRGVLTAAGAVQTTYANFRENMEDVVADAQSPVNDSSDGAEDNCTISMAAKNHGRRFAVTAAAGVLAFRNEVQGIVEEARSGRETVPEDFGPPAGEETKGRRRTALKSNEEPSAFRDHDPIEPDGLEASTVDIASDAPARRRSRSKL